jgi:hypothetical protein
VIGCDSVIARRAMPDVAISCHLEIPTLTSFARNDVDRDDRDYRDDRDQWDQRDQMDDSDNDADSDFS